MRAGTGEAPGFERNEYSIYSEFQKYVRHKCSSSIAAPLETGLCVPRRPRTSPRQLRAIPADRPEPDGGSGASDPLRRSRGSGAKAGDAKEVHLFRKVAPHSYVKIRLFERPAKL